MKDILDQLNYSTLFIYIQNEIECIFMGFFLYFEMWTLNQCQAPLNPKA